MMKIRLNKEFVVRYWLINDVVMGFEAFRVIGESDSFLYEKKNSNHGMDSTEDLDDAQIFVSGDIKWDGCSNIYFNEQDNGMIHFCDKKSTVDLGIMLGRLYDIASEVIPNVDKNLIK